MNSAPVILVAAVSGSQKSETHGVVSIGNRKALFLPEQPARAGHKRFAKDHRPYSQSPQEPLPVIESLGAATEFARVKALVVVRRLAIIVEPTDERIDGRGDFCSLHCFHSFV